MAINVIRKKSKVPNITNRMDVRMIRYAYGGTDGVVKDYGDQLNIAVQSGTNKFTIESGIAVIQGWEVEIETPGVTMAVPLSSGNKNYFVYIKLSLPTETATIELAESDTIPESDDLTKYPNGIAYLLLYEINVKNNVIQNTPVKKVKVIEYTNSAFENFSKNVEIQVNELKNSIPTYKLIFNGYHGKNQRVEASQLSETVKKGDLLMIVSWHDSDHRSDARGLTHVTLLDLNESKTESGTKYFSYSSKYSNIVKDSNLILFENVVMVPTYTSASNYTILQYVEAQLSTVAINYTNPVTPGKNSHGGDAVYIDRIYKIDRKLR